MRRFKSISFCTTCCNRLWQLKETLPINLNLYKDNENVEFILVNMNSDDGLDEYIKTNTVTVEAIKHQRLLYAYNKHSQFYSSPIAKNIAHRLATHDILFNLDADQYIDNIVDNCLSFKWTDNMFIHYENRPMQTGSWGRICISKDLFYRLGGYDESFLPMGYQDCDLMKRAIASGASKFTFKVNQQYISISNTVQQKVENTKSDIPWKEMREMNMIKSQENIKNNKLIANQNGWGECSLLLNFKENEDYFPPVVP